MSVVKFNLFELPHASNVSAAGYFPVVAEQTKVNEDDICAYAEKSTTLTEADIKATFSMLARYLVDRENAPAQTSFILRKVLDKEDYDIFQLFWVGCRTHSFHYLRIHSPFKFENR